MESDRLIHQLKEWEKDIFDEWLRRMYRAGQANPRTTGHEDFHRRFNGLLAALESCFPNDPTAAPAKDTHDKVCLAQPLANEARFGQQRGMDLEFFLGYLKTMVSCIEEKLAETEPHSPLRTDVILKLRRVADFTEMAIVAGWQTPEQAASAQKSVRRATSDKLLGAIFMSVGEGIILLDEDFEIVRANQHACEIYGIQHQNMMGANIRSLMEEEDAGLLIRHLEDLIEGQRRCIEATCLYVDGKTFPATVTAARSDLEGKRYWSLIVRDDTQQKIMETQIRQEKRQIEEMNLTLKTIMKSIEQDRKDFENRVTSKIKTSLLPGLKKIDTAAEAGVRKSYLAILEKQLLGLTTGFDKELDAGLLKLTKTEIEVCRLIQAGCSSKEVCEAMKLSFDTVQTHRKNIRKKLGLRGEKLNLHAFLMNRVL
ncbi:MAG TPA: PAS and helix-turn-helix domain-containing protein [Smithellaceae bacterium]|nr:PAS and helix-turn-helix domain-containing protein [Smithellaceae bacterium]HRV44556.1 PAS and helix-turn-helix domain-containing protein [Smithellaceae bacterium]